MSTPFVRSNGILIQVITCTINWCYVCFWWKVMSAMVARARVTVPHLSHVFAIGWLAHALMNWSMMSLLQKGVIVLRMYWSKNLGHSFCFNCAIVALTFAQRFAFNPAEMPVLILFSTCWVNPGGHKDSVFRITFTFSLTFRSNSAFSTRGLSVLDSLRSRLSSFLVRFEASVLNFFCTFLLISSYLVSLGLLHIRLVGDSFLKNLKNGKSLEE